MQSPDDVDVVAELHAAMAEDPAHAVPPQWNVKQRIVLIGFGVLLAVVAAAAGSHWYRSHQWRSQGIGPSIDEMQWTGQERLDFRAAKKAVDQWLVGQGFEQVPLTQTSPNARELAQGLSVKKAPLDEQIWYRSPPQRGQPFYVVTFVHSSATDWENIRVEYLGCFVVWEYSGFRWNVDANEERAESFLKGARQWWEETSGRVTSNGLPKFRPT